MKKCMVYGNCHIWPIRKYLMSSKSFSRSYQMIEVDPVHQCNMDKGLNEELIKNCDLFIYQKVGDAFGPYLSTDYLLGQLPDQCIRISFGNAYFKGYYPSFDTDPKFPYGDVSVRKLLHEGKRKEEIISILSDEDFYSYEEVITTLEESFKELRSREKNIDIPVCDYIEKNYQSKHLFYTFNHPNYHIIRYLAKRMLEMLGISKREIAHIVYDKEFSNEIHPIYPSVVKHLKLSCINRNHRFTLKNQFYLTFEEYIAAYIDALLN